MSSVLTQLQRRVEPALPGRDYHDSGVFELERRRIFHRKWFCVGREEQAPLRGDFFVIDVIDESILVVRGDDLVLRAFYNVCRHRGSELCEGTGQFKSVIKCPYHSWCYALDGRLVGTPNVGRDEGLDRQSYGLHPVALETWEGFVFANLLSDTVMTYLLLPSAPDRTRVVSEYLFRPEVASRADFDPSPVVSFLDLVSRQDWAVCERAQRGVRSRAFDRGVLPWNDRLLHVFAQRYLRERDGE